jgi:hypothetical protein
MVRGIDCTGPARKGTRPRSFTLDQRSSCSGTIAHCAHTCLGTLRRTRSVERDHAFFDWRGIRLSEAEQLATNLRDRSLSSRHPSLQPILHSSNPFCPSDSPLFASERQGDKWEGIFLGKESQTRLLQRHINASHRVQERQGLWKCRKREWRAGRTRFWDVGPGRGTLRRSCSLKTLLPALQRAVQGHKGLNTGIPVENILRAVAFRSNRRRVRLLGQSRCTK